MRKNIVAGNWKMNKNLQEGIALAKELNVSFTSINRWENEKTVPSRKTQMMIDSYCEKKNIKITDTERKDG